MSKNQSNSPFSPTDLYNEVTYQDWQNIAKKSMKDADYSALEQISKDGIPMHPLYTKADAQNVHALAPKPRDSFGVWDIRQRVFVENEIDANKIAIDELENGTNSIEFEFENSEIDFNALNNGVFTNLACIGLIGYENGLKIAQKLIKQTKSQELSQAIFAFNLNPSTLKSLGFETYSLNDAIDFYKTNFENAPKCKYFLASSNWLIEIGASRALQVAILIASGIEWLKTGEENGISAQAINDALLFKIGTDGEVVLEIAKLRAARLLWAKIGAQIGANLSMDLQAIVANHMLEAINPYTNILRITNACFAASCGGANIISTPDFQIDAENQNDFTRRIARNTQIVLSGESHIARVNDPAAGAYAFEALTNHIAQNAWELVQKIEAKGGLDKAVQTGLIAQMIDDETKEII